MTSVKRSKWPASSRVSRATSLQLSVLSSVRGTRCR
ncbi:hypothetical protein L917_07563 [Phytophthora nicotianae]|uniref:Uncharacterized protein n=1 Tax=Phytophthora nicotianae TaxID=4792 RepID=W2J6D7_PHYNI|nr:hypothetical protein L915_07750 [Phytophthora nicotianae]ETL41302.1 hypothetical protein L916_07679 [Phytophthora nicotianae]ETL94469.1 hypothetical protein L917_07563 [Phytophthora nicotianae]